MKSHSQHGEDAFIAPLIDRRSAPYVVDVGANDGFSWSNSYAFVKRGYSALLIEPMASYAEKCRERHLGNPKVIVEEVAILPHEGRTKFYVTQDSEADLLAMTSSVRREIIAIENVEIEVQCCPLDTLLKRHSVPHDYALLNVDAEGVDLQVLQTAGLARWRPSIICVEYGQAEADINALLTGHGYERRELLGGVNGIYRRL